MNLHKYMMQNMNAFAALFIELLATSSSYPFLQFEDLQNWLEGNEGRAAKAMEEAFILSLRHQDPRDWQGRITRPNSDI